jgi:hypothetical protein
LLAHPTLIVSLPVMSFYWLWPITWRLIIGMVGTDHGLLSAWEYPCLLFALGVSALGTLAGRMEGWRAADTGLALLALFAAFIGMELSLYLTYNTAGAGLIIGVESRYYLPFLPFVIFILAWAGGPLGRLPGATRLSIIAPGWFCLPAVALAFVNSFALPTFIFNLYRTTGP